MPIRVARFLDVADGVQPGQFTVGSHETISSLSDLEPKYRQLIDEPVTAVISVTGGNGRSNLTPVWFDYEDDTVLLNLATHRKKVGWLRNEPAGDVHPVNPENAYHWLSIKTTVAREISEEDPDEGDRVVKQLDKVWTKYTGNEPPYALRDPSIEEGRVLFEMPVDSVAIFGRP